MTVEFARANLAAAIASLHPHANAAYRVQLAQAIEVLIEAKIGAPDSRPLGRPVPHHGSGPDNI